VDRRAKVELFEQIRREYEHGGGTIRGIAKKLGIHRRMVREAVLRAVPLERKTPVREKPKLEPAMAFIDAVLEADKQAPRKQRHTAHRIWCRIRAELPEVEVAESTIRRHVRKRKIALALLHRETFIPQSYVWGGEAQVDWYEAYADICGERELAYVFNLKFAQKLRPQIQFDAKAINFFFKINLNSLGSFSTAPVVRSLHTLIRPSLSE
jgi:hypothetical protein